jgi:hypothetical protein
LTPLLQTVLLVIGSATTNAPALDSTCGVGWKALDLAVGTTSKGHLLAIRDLNGVLKTMEWDSSTGKWSAWSPLPSQPLANGAPWIQSPTYVAGLGSTNNVFALDSTPGKIRLSQWTRSADGTVRTTIGIGQADSLLYRPVCAHLGPNGQQALFGVFRDSSLRMRVWDSLGSSWGPWSSLALKSAYAPTANQVGPNDVNVFATLPDGSIKQKWWTAGAWSAWGVPASAGAISEPSSVNLDATDHLLFSFDSIHQPQVRYWNGAYWTSWSRLTFPVNRGLSPVVVGPGAILLYGLDSSNQIVRIGWKKVGGWSAPETLGQGSCKPVRPRDSRILSAARTPSGVMLAIRGWNDSIYTMNLGFGQNPSNCWSALPGQPRTLSNPWLQAAWGGANSLVALGDSNGTPRIFQWTHQHGAFQSTTDLGESDSVLALASGNLDSTGRQALFAWFQDSSVRMRTRDSAGGSWGAWKSLGQKSSHSIDVAQTRPNELNLYSIGIGGRIDQRWWDRTGWRPWVVPSRDSIASGASSANFDGENHVLFGIGPDKFLVERTWNGLAWTGWRALPWKPRGEVSPVVVDSILNLFLVTPDSSVLMASRKLGSDWSGTSFVGKVPPTATCSDLSLPISAGVKIRHSTALHHGMLALPSDLVPYSGPVVFVGVDGSTTRTSKAAGVREIAVPGQGIGFVKVGTTVLRILQTR